MRIISALRNGCDDSGVWRWRGTLVHDLDFFPQYDPELIRTRCLQKLGVLKWPAATLLAGVTPVAVIGAAPNRSGGIDLWAAFSPFAQMSRLAVARRMRREMPRLRHAANGRPISICVDLRLPRAAEFARFLGFRPTGIFERDPLSGQPMELWKCQAW